VTCEVILMVLGQSVSIVYSYWASWCPRFFIFSVHSHSIWRRVTKFGIMTIYG